MNVLSELQLRNAPLFWFGIICGALAMVLLLLMVVDKRQFLGVTVWLKPFKFFVSTGFFAWTMAWFLVYLPEVDAVSRYTWMSIGVLTFEDVYILWQASRGQRSHFNVSTPFYSIMFSLMGVAISVMTAWTAYIGYLFCIHDFPELSITYVWAIRLGIFIFVVFAFEGGLMGSRLSHTVGAPDGGPGLPLLNWSKQHGDLRVAHFIGMHALQILPLIGYFLAAHVWQVILISIAYAMLAILVFVQALRGKPLFHSN